MATKRRSGKKPAARRAIVVVGKKRRRKSVSGVGRTHHRRRPAAPLLVHRRRRKKHGGLLGATGSAAGVKQIVIMAGGVAAGALGTHYLLRPLEHKLVERFPMAAKFLAVGEILVGGYIAMKAKHPFIKAAGVGILANGVHGGMKQLNIGHEMPGAGIGDSEYHTIEIPMGGNGDVRAMVAGLIRDDRRNVQTETVAGRMDHNLNHTSYVAGTEDDYVAKGYDY